VTLDHTHLLLDLDGTVLDFEASQAQALRETVGGLGVDWHDDHATTYARINMQLWEAYERREIDASQQRLLRWQRYLEALEVEADHEAVGADYLKAFAAGAHLLDGAAEAVAALADRMTLVAVTNGFGDVQHERLERAGLMDHLAGVVVSDEVGAAKPAPEIFDVAFEVAGHPPRERVAIVGDSLTSDIAGGRSYGITTVADHAPHPAPDHVIERLADLV
jgi:2-haloacid dehalogenase